MSPDGQAGRRRPTVRLALAVTVAVLAGAVAAHATLVFGTVDTDPSPPAADAPFDVVLEMRDPVDAPVEDAVVFVEATGPDGTTFIESDRFAEVEPGLYRSELALSDAGEWTLVFRDQTFRQEEAQATLTLRVGPDGSTEELSFVFPPTATGPTNLTTWLVWLIGLPLLAGAIVTVIVLRGGRDEGARDDAEDEGSRA